MRWKLEHILKKHGSRILLENDSIIILNKSAGVLVLPDRFNPDTLNLYALLKETFGTIFVVHRIDRETSGVVLFAKNAEMHSFLNTMFERRQVKKKYRAIVVGKPFADGGSIDLPIAGNEHGVRKMKIDKKNGKEAETEYSVIEKFKDFALVEARPLTGRTHQIRLHLSAIGLPVLADPLYGNGSRFFLSSVKRNYKSHGEEKPLLARTALHAYSLSFRYPTSDEMIFIQTPIPKDMDTVLKVLKKYEGR
jgi:23S rRNA pseudouridine1911/1915/1917 synthase